MASITTTLTTYTGTVPDRDTQTQTEFDAAASDLMSYVKDYSDELNDWSPEVNAVSAEVSGNAASASASKTAAAASAAAAATSERNIDSGIASLSASEAATVAHNASVFAHENYTPLFDRICGIAGIEPTLFLDFQKQDYRIYTPRYGLEKYGLQDLSTFLNVSRANGNGGIYTATGKYALAGNDVPRLDYDPELGGCRGLLVEESRTNYLPNTTDPSGWGVNNNATFTTGALGPDGLANAFTVIVSADSGRVGFSLSGRSVGESFVSGFWVRRRTGTGSITHRVGSNVSGDYVLTDNWSYIERTADLDDTSARFYINLNSSGDSIDICYPDLQKGSFITSHIPTSGTQVTRAADIVTIDGEDFANIWNPSEMSILLKYQASDSLNRRALRITNAVEATGIDAVAGSSGGLGAYWFGDYNGSTQFSLLSTLRDATDLYTLSLGLAENNATAYRDGGSEATDSSCTMFSNPTEMYIGGAETNRINGPFPLLALFPKRLTNTQLQQLSALGFNQ